MQKISIINVWKGSKFTSAAVSISCIVIKKNAKIKYINTNLLKDLSGNTLAWNISLILTPYNSHKGNSRPEVFCKKDVLRTFTKFTGKHLCKSLFFNKIAGLRPATLFKKRLWQKSFPVNFAKFLRTPFLQNTSGWLLLSQKTQFQCKLTDQKPP